MYVCMYVCIYVCMYVCMYVYIYVSKYGCVCVCVYIANIIFTQDICVVHAVKGRVFARSNKYTFKELIHESTNFIFGISHGFDITYDLLVMD